MCKKTNHKAWIFEVVFGGELNWLHLIIDLTYIPVY